MLSRLAVLSRYTGVNVARQAGISRLAQASVPLAFAHVSQRTGLTAYQGFASSAVQQWEARGRGGNRDSRPSRPRRNSTPREPMPPSERLYVGNINDANRTEVTAFIQQQPGLITLHDELHHDGQRRNFVHLTFKSTGEAVTAKNAIHERFEQTGLRLDYAATERSNKLYIGDISPSIRPWVLEEIAKVPGFERFHDYPDRDGQPREFLHAQFESIDNASSAHKSLTSLFEEKGIRIDFAKEKKSPEAPALAEEPREPAPPSTELFITNLPFYAEEAELSAVFEQLPGYVQVSIAKDFSGRNKGFGKVRFETVEQAQEAIDSIRDLTIRDRQLRAEFANQPTVRSRPPTSRLFIGGLPFNATEEAVRAALQNHQGLASIDVRVDSQSGKPAWAVASFDTIEQAQEVLAAHQHKPFTPGGPAMRLDFHHDRRPVAGVKEQPTNPPSRSLFIGGIKSRSVDELYEIFAEYPPKAARVATDPTGRPRGFGYVDYASVEEAQRAQEALNGSDIGSNSVVRVDFATERPERSEQRSSYGSGRGGGGGGRGGGYGGGRDREDRGGREDRGRGGRGGDREGRGRGGGGGWSAGDSPNQPTYGSRGGRSGGRPQGGRGGDPRGGEYPSTW